MAQSSGSSSRTRRQAVRASSRRSVAEVQADEAAVDGGRVGVEPPGRLVGADGLDEPALVLLGRGAGEESGALRGGRVPAASRAGRGRGRRAYLRRVAAGGGTAWATRATAQARKVRIEGGMVPVTSRSMRAGGGPPARTERAGLDCNRKGRLNLGVDQSDRRAG